MNRGIPDKETDVVIIGASISGSAHHSMFSYVRGNIRSIMIDRLSDQGQLNSHYSQNSQTLHESDIESTVDTFERAIKIHKGAGMYKNILLDHGHDTSHLYKKMGKMMIGVGDEEVNFTKDRHNLFTVQSKLFPNNRLLSREEINEIEPALIAGRNPKEDIVAYYNPEGLAVDFGATCPLLVKIAEKTRGEAAQMLMGNGVDRIERVGNNGDCFDTILEDKTRIRSKAIIVNAGAYTNVLMDDLGYGDSVGIIPLAANFYGLDPSFPYKISNKIYTKQKKNLPNASLHVDPGVHGDEVRLGPTAYGILYLEKKKWSSFFDYVGIMDVKKDLRSIISVMSNPEIRNYFLRNYLYKLPFYGKQLLVNDARKIIPTMNYSDIRKIPGAGGNRGQEIDRETRVINYGGGKIVGKNENIIGDPTPSPGASIAFYNALTNIQLLMNMRGFEGKFSLDKEAIKRDFGNVLD